MNPAALTITANNASMTYGGSALPGLSASYNGFVNGDSASSLTAGPSLATTATAYNGTAGSASHVGSYAITASGAVDADYTISYVQGALTVNPAALTITANNASMTYGGSALPGLSASYNGFVNGDSAGSLTTGPSLATTATAYNGTAGSASHVGSYAITASGAVDADYTISYVQGALTVNPAALTITANNASMTYGGSALPGLSASYNGFVNGDSAGSLTTGPSLATTATAYNGTAGSASHVGSYAITASGAVDADYTISYVQGALTILPGTPTITAGPSITSYPSLYSDKANVAWFNSVAAMPSALNFDALVATDAPGRDLGTQETNRGSACGAHFHSATLEGNVIVIGIAPDEDCRAAPN